MQVKENVPYFNISGYYYNEFKMKFMKKNSSKSLAAPTENKDYQQALLDEIIFMRKALLNQASLKTKFLQGMAGGLGTVVGATVLVALVLFILNQFASIEILEPIVHRVIEIIDKTGK